MQANAEEMQETFYHMDFQQETSWKCERLPHVGELATLNKLYFSQNHERAETNV